MLYPKTNATESTGRDSDFRPTDPLASKKYLFTCDHLTVPCDYLQYHVITLQYHVITLQYHYKRTASHLLSSLRNDNTLQLATDKR